MSVSRNGIPVRPRISVCGVTNKYGTVGSIGMLLRETTPAGGSLCTSVPHLCPSVIAVARCSALVLDPSLTPGSRAGRLSPATSGDCREGLDVFVGSGGLAGLAVHLRWITPAIGRV